MVSKTVIRPTKSDPLIKELVKTKQTEENKVLPNYILLQICTLILFHSYSMKIVLPVPDNWKNITDQYKTRNS